MTRPLQSTLFGGTELARSTSSATVQAQGYAAAPGTGPVDETCGTCLHCVRKGRFERHWFKCQLMRARWTACRSTDILVSSPACERFQASPMPIKPKRKPKKPKARKSLPERLE